MRRTRRLRTIERLRDRTVREREAEFAHRAREVQQGEQQLDYLRGAEREALGRVLQPMQSDSAPALWAGLAETLRMERGRTSLALVATRRKAEEARQALVAAEQELKAVERLRERWEEEGRTEELRAEERALNDRNAAAYARRMIQGGPGGA